MSEYGPRIAALARRAGRDRARLERRDPSDLDATAADRYLRNGVGPAIWCYVEGRTGGRRVRFSPAEYAALEGAMNAWLECYARCHGVDLDADFVLREAAELLIETRNIHDVGRLLTGVPARDA